MIDKLKKKFITLSMVSLFVLLLLIVIGMNAISYTSMAKEADDILAFLSKHQGRFPEFGGIDEFEGSDGRVPGPMPNHITKETPYESRYFTVMYTTSGELLQVETSKIASVTSDEAVKYAQTALSKMDNKGFMDNFRFHKFYDNEKYIVTFLDCGKKLDSFKVFLAASSGMALVGFLVVFFVICYFSEKFVRPMAESYEKQKRFITDAGHEMRTPLTIINANADILEMEIGENESLSDIKSQSKRLSKLTNDLVKLSRMEETKKVTESVDFPLSDVIAETILTFNPLALSQQKQIKCEIQPMISINGNPQYIEQLVSILMDNAIKYSPTDSTIEVNMKKESKNVVVEIANKTDNNLTSDKLKNIFDRFYRMDTSRNSERGGYGIGLSIAKAIVISHNGKISAHAKDSHTFVINVTLPI